MVVDPRPGQAAQDVDRALTLLGASSSAASITAACGTGWAAAAIAPPGNPAGGGAGLSTRGGSALIWTGDMILPAEWSFDPTGLCPPDPGEILLARLMKGGVEVLAQVDGPFCGAWYDAPAARWVVFNDRFGLLPVFYAVRDERLAVATTAALAWQLSGLELTFDEHGIVDVLRAMNVTQDRTLIRGVHWLVGGHTLVRERLTGERSRCLVSRYWEFRQQAEMFATPAQAADAYLDAFQRTVAEQADGADPLLVGISGGMDSRVILAVCHKLGLVPDCFTCGFPFSEDVRYGRRLARVAGAPHTFIPMHTDLVLDGLTASIIETDGLHGALHLVNSLPFPGYLAGRRGGVMLEGHLHGILGGGCVPADEDIPANRPPHQCAWARKHAHAGGSIDLVNHLLRADLAQESLARWRTRIDDAYARTVGGDPLQRAEQAMVNGRHGRNDVLGPGLLRHDVLIRSPATGRRLLDWYAATPPAWRRGKQFYVHVLRERFPAFARVQRSDCSGLPIAADRWLREYHWQNEKLHRMWAWLRHPEVRRFRSTGHLMAAWLFDTWAHRGDLGLIRQSDARIRPYVDQAALLDCWVRAPRDPSAVRPLLTLGTIEIMLRDLENRPRINGSAYPTGIRYRRVDSPQTTTPATTRPIPREVVL